MAVRIYSKADLSETLGNDIVDLCEKEPDLHPGFIARVFTAQEQAFIGSDTGKLWLNWAAKEAAYKAIKRIYPETIFSPIEFCLNNSGFVHFQRHRLPCRLFLTRKYAYCICANREDVLQSKNLFSWIEALPYKSGDGKLTGDPSAAVRTLAKAKIAEILSCGESEIEISKKTADLLDARKSSAPRLVIMGEDSEDILSFSHHGRFIACAIHFLRGRK